MCQLSLRPATPEVHTCNLAKPCFFDPAGKMTDRLTLGSVSIATPCLSTGKISLPQWNARR
ncbi:hypothetical protein CCM_02044 [Cordyceps militaris CM01]|uniref:Uncharacterized protein n=1 Tax=Cordyceps militaris (strain CM01) TaxID=983644 RepID=G3JCB0_CORMM|nr:uncharacterized protein CCM_02044 [Cordyceps militaris CM01]EGX93775.1 hypothetical protein CCM_02044 [Cordyceps militaris CM01]